MDKLFANILTTTTLRHTILVSTNHNGYRSPSLLATFATLISVRTVHRCRSAQFCPHIKIWRSCQGNCSTKEFLCLVRIRIPTDQGIGPLIQPTPPVGQDEKTSHRRSFLPSGPHRRRTADTRPQRSHRKRKPQVHRQASGRIRESSF